MNDNPNYDHARQIRNVIQIGVIADVDVAGGLARVRVGDLHTNWLPWVCQRAGSVKIWSAPTVGEQCLLFSPGGNTALGAILPGIFSNNMPAPAGSANDVVIEIPEGGKFLVQCGSSSLEINSSNIEALATRIDLNE